MEDYILMFVGWMFVLAGWICGTNAAKLLKQKDKLGFWVLNTCSVLFFAVGTGVLVWWLV